MSSPHKDIPLTNSDILPNQKTSYSIKNKMSFKLASACQFAMKYKCRLTREGKTAKIYQYYKNYYYCNPNSCIIGIFQLPNDSINLVALAATESAVGIPASRLLTINLLGLSDLTCSTTC